MAQRTEKRCSLGSLAVRHRFDFDEDAPVGPEHSTHVLNRGPSGVTNPADRVLDP